METPQIAYGQKATHFALRFFIRSEAEVGGGLIVELANLFLSELILPGSRLTSLDTKRPGMGAALNMGAFSDRRWNASVKKVLAGQYAVLGLKAEMQDCPNQKIWFGAHVNPPGKNEFLGAGTIDVMCSVSYLRQLAASPARVEALLEFGRKVWKGIKDGPAYGFGNLAITLARPAFDPLHPPPPGTPFPPDYIKPPAERVHAIPVAYVGNDIDGNLETLYCGNRGIKGAFWANYLNKVHIDMAGGAAQIRAKLAGVHVEGLDHDGLLVVATDSPLPDDTEPNRQRFLQVHDALQPAFLSREETPERKRGMLGCFYRERSPEITGIGRRSEQH